MTLKVGIGLSFYEDFDSLHRMLMSCQGYPITKIIAVDGKYKEHPANTELSSEKCRALFKSFQTPYTLYDAPNLTEIEKRQIYFDESNNLVDVLIVMDSDEYFISKNTQWELFMNDLENKIGLDYFHQDIIAFRQNYWITCLENVKGYERIRFRSRIFFKPNQLQYVDDHYSIRNKQTGTKLTFSDRIIIEHIAIGHDYLLRNKDSEYSYQRLIYQERLKAKESVERKQRQDDFIRKVKSTS